MANQKFDTLKARLNDPDKIRWLEERAAIRQYDCCSTGDSDEIVESAESRNKAEEMACKDWFDMGADFFRMKDQK